ncbi:MAG: hypothetical protein EOO30_17605 [Comamonadaceae bacterium]|nr:MAG: hypothetical protein EOO30_17605 [Comamonadaceae bacterium]
MAGPSRPSAIGLFPARIHGLPSNLPSLIFWAAGAVPWLPPARNHHQQEECMVKPNYGFAKRQRELEKKRKKEEKAQKKDARPDDAQPASEAAPAQPSPAPQGE